MFMKVIYASNHFFMDKNCLINRSIQAAARRRTGPFRLSEYIGFPAHFRHFLENVFSISSRTLWNVGFNFVFGRSILKHCHPFSSTAIKITVAEHETANTILSIGIHFLQSFNQIRLPDVKAQ